MNPSKQVEAVQTSVAGDVQRLKAVLGPLPQRGVKPVLVVMSGLPGTGKSTLARNLAQRLPLVVLESDYLRRVLVGKPRHTSGESTRLFAACHQLIHELLGQGVPVLFDATNLQESHRAPLYQIAQSTDAKLILVRTKAPQEVVFQRLQQRRQRDTPNNHTAADWVVYQRMRLAVDRIRKNHFVLDTSTDVTPAIEWVVHEVNQWLQRSPHHEKGDANGDTGYPR